MHNWQMVFRLPRILFSVQLAAVAVISFLTQFVVYKLSLSLLLPSSEFNLLNYL